MITNQTISESVSEELDALLDASEPIITTLSNAAAHLYTSLDRINWCGFYLYDGEKLVLGPFGGKPACTTVPMGKGVCGTAAEKQETIVVDDVNAFPGHIACDAASRSEVVVPLMSNGKLIGVLDVDSPELSRFDAATVQTLENCVLIVTRTIASRLNSDGRVSIQ